MPAQEAAQTMELPPGFRCQVFAAEPDVQQPIAMAWDFRGRLWVAECHTYAEMPRRWNTELRDRILIFEDSDNDGHFDKRTVFWDGGVRLTSIALARDGVYALCAPQLLFIPDRNGDDIPDEAPRAILDGFAYKSVGHNIANGLCWGPDGWLYGRHGILESSFLGEPGTPHAERTELNCGIFRFNPDTRRVEVVCHGGTNPWGMDWNAEGELFWTNTVIGHLWHGIPGAYYERMFGSHSNRHVYEAIPQTADHYHFDHSAEKWSDIRSRPMSAQTDALGGGHAHCGCLIYQGGTWPAAYHGNLFTLNLHGRRINMESLSREGCGYVARHQGDFMRAKDPWFRGVDIGSGPDGNIYVLDWSDAGECHDNDGVHRGSGRIYKISHGAQAPLPPFNLTQQDTATLRRSAADHSGNVWWTRMARLLLQSPEPPRVPRPQDAQSEDGLQRLHLASDLQRLPLEERFSVAQSLASRPGDATDRQLPLLVWYGVEPAVSQYPSKAISLAVQSRFPKLTRFIARRLAEDIEQRPEPVNQLLDAAIHNPGARAEIARGLNDGLRGLRKVTKPASWEALSRELLNETPDIERELALVFGSGRAMEELLSQMKDASADANARERALSAILDSGEDRHFPAIAALIQDRSLGTAARLGCARFPDAPVPQLFLDKWPSRADWRKACITVLCSRVPWALELLERASHNAEIRSEISAYEARHMRNLGDEKLQQKITEVLGDIRETPESKRESIARWEAVLTAQNIASANLDEGRRVFDSVCAGCHKLGDKGASLGPDLTGSDRRNLSYLLENLIDPNAVVPPDYRVTVLQLKDGRTLTGVVPERGERAWILQTPLERIPVPVQDINSVKTLPQSLMPEGLLDALGLDKARDLIGFLMQ